MNKEGCQVSLSYTECKLVKENILVQTSLESILQRLSSLNWKNLSLGEPCNCNQQYLDMGDNRWLDSLLCQVCGNSVEPACSVVHIGLDKQTRTRKGHVHGDEACGSQRVPALLI